MVYTVSVTGGRRITIPIEFRRKLGWDKPTKILLEAEGNKIILEDLKKLK